MPLNLFYTMVQKCQKWPKTQIKGGSCLKEVRGSFAILFWLPCATWHRVMTHTHHTQSFRSTDAFLRHSTPGPISEVSWGFLLHPSGLSFGFQARCTGSTRTNKRRRFQKSSVVDWMMPESEEWISRKRRRRRSIDEQASGCMVDLLNLSWAVLCGRQCDFSFFCAGGPGEWAVVRLLRRRWTPAQDSCWSWQRRLLDVDLVSVFTISQSAFLWQCCTSIFIFVVLHLCTRRMISHQSPLKQTDSSWILHLE